MKKKSVYPSLDERSSKAVRKLSFDGVRPVSSCEELCRFLQKTATFPLKRLKEWLKITSLQKGEKKAVLRKCKEVFGRSVM